MENCSGFFPTQSYIARPSGEKVLHLGMWFARQYGLPRHVLCPGVWFAPPGQAGARAIV